MLIYSCWALKTTATLENYLTVLKKATNTVGLHPTGLQGLHLPSFRTKNRAWSQQQRHRWFSGWRSLYVWSKVLEWHPTVADGGQDIAAGFIMRTRGDYQLMSDWFISYQGNEQMGMPPHDPFDKLLLAGAWGKYIKRSVMRIGCRWSRHWSGSGYTENKRMANFSGLTTYKHTAHYPAIPLLYI